MDIVRFAWATLMVVFIFSLTCSIGKEWTLGLGALLIE